MTDQETIYDSWESVPSYIRDAMMERGKKYYVSWDCRSEGYKDWYMWDDIMTIGDKSFEITWFIRDMHRRFRPNIDITKENPLHVKQIRKLINYLV